MFALIALLAGGVWWLSTYPVALGPDLRARAAAAIDPLLAPHDLTLSFDSLAVGIGPGLRPMVQAAGLRLTGPLGNSVALDRAVLRFDRSSLLEGEIAPQSIQLAGLRLAITRAVEGAVTVETGPATLFAGIDTPGALIANIRALLAQGPLAELRTLGASDLSLRITD
ncbi:MAG: hypothetical protein AAGH41_14615, partial [Pseudomonadota bacterium]